MEPIQKRYRRVKNGANDKENLLNWDKKEAVRTADEAESSKREDRMTLVVTGRNTIVNVSPCRFQAGMSHSSAVTRIQELKRELEQIK